MAKLNAAQQIHQFLGVGISDGHKQAYGGKNASATKAGTGRYAVAGKPGNRISKARPQRAYVALTAAWASKVVTKARLRDQHGAYTVVGRKTAFNGETIRRMWLGGISAQRGY